MMPALNPLLDWFFTFAKYRLNTKVFNLLHGHDESSPGTRHLSFLGLPICNRGFCRLLGIGKTRFSTLSKSVRAGDRVAPLDGRYLPRGPGKQSHKRSLVYDFLHNLWLTTGESLPDAGHSSSNKRPRQGSYKLDSPALDRKKLRHLPLENLPIIIGSASPSIHRRIYQGNCFYQLAAQFS